MNPNTPLTVRRSAGKRSGKLYVFPALLLSLGALLFLTACPVGIGVNQGYYSGYGYGPSYYGGYGYGGGYYRGAYLIGGRGYGHHYGGHHLIGRRGFGHHGFGHRGF